MFNLEGIGLLIIALSQRLSTGSWPTPEGLKAHLQALGTQGVSSFAWVSHQPSAPAQVLDLAIRVLQLFRQHLG